MKSNVGWFAGLTVIFAIFTSTIAEATTITIGDSRDTTLYKSQGDRANGAGSVMYAGQDPGGASSSKHALMAFDIASNVPAGSTIQSVQLALTFTAAAGSGGTPGAGDSTPRQLDLLRMTSNWAEGTSGSGSGFSGSGVGFTASTGEATWNDEAYPSTSWATAGGGGDFVSTISASTIVGNPNTNSVFTWGSSANMLADVQLWLDTPSQNFGWVLKADNETTTQSYRGFFTRDTSTVSFRPSLTIDYVPEPSALTTLLLGAVGFVLVIRPTRRLAHSSDPRPL